MAQTGDFWAVDFWAPDFWAVNFWADVTTVTEEEEPSGGYGWENQYDAHRQKTRRRRKVRKRVRKLVSKLPDKVDREIAVRMQRVVEREAQEKEVIELTRILEVANQQQVLARIENLGLLREYEAALELKTFSAMQRLERLMEESYTAEEEYFMILLAL